MDACQWLTFAGAGFEILGLVAVAVGLSETRRAFTDRPSLVGRFVRPIRRWWARLRGHEQIVEISAASEISVAMSARGTVITNWDDLTLEERVARLQEYVTRHEDVIGRLDDRIDREEGARKAGDKTEAREREALRATLEERISKAAAGGLTIETWGVAFFALGVILAAAGSIMTCG